MSDIAMYMYMYTIQLWICVYKHRGRYIEISYMLMYNMSATCTSFRDGLQFAAQMCCLLRPFARSKTFASPHATIKLQVSSQRQRDVCVVMCLFVCRVFVTLFIFLLVRVFVSLCICSCVFACGS